MNLKQSITFFVAFSIMILTAPMTAYSQTLLFDYGPTTGTDAGNWVNLTSGQNFAEKFSFPVQTIVGRIDIFTSYNFSSPFSVHVKILNDAGGSPGAYLYQEDQTISSYTTSGIYRVITCILATPFVAQANTTYWIGVSSNGGEIGQSSVRTPGDGTMAQFSGSTFTNFPGIGDMMFQLYGVHSDPPASIPTMNEWGIIFMSLILAGSAIWMIRRRTS